jgi:DNA gyrase subunit A
VGGDKPIRIVSRGSQGVIVFDTAEGEKVVSVEHISEPEAAEDLPPPEMPEAPPANE